MFVENSKFYPKVITINFDFTVLHQEKLGQGKDASKGIINSWIGKNRNYPFGDT